MRIGQHSFELFAPVWRFYRWYDSLDRLGFGGERFIIFMSLFVCAMFLPVTFAVTLGYEPMAGQVIGYVLIGFLALTRSYWVSYYKR